MNKHASLTLAAAAALSLTVATTHAQWLAAPVDGLYTNTANWTANTINGTFGNSTGTAVSVTNGRFENLTFNGTNTAYTLTSTGAGSFTFGNGGGITVAASDTVDQIINSNLAQNATSTLRTVFLATNSTTGKLVINGNYAGGSSTIGLNTNLRLGGTGGNGILNGVVSDGTLGGSLVVMKTGGTNSNSTWELDGANTYTGGTEIGSGSGALVLGNKAALGAGAVRVVAGAVFSSNTDLSGANAITNTINYVGNSGTSTTTNASLNFTAGTNTATLAVGTSPAVGDMVLFAGTGYNFVPFYTRVTGVSGSTITLSNNAALTGNSATTNTAPFNSGGSATIAIGGTNNLEFSGTQNLTSTDSNLTGATQTFNVSNTGVTTFSGVLRELGGTGSFTKTGAGVLVLTGANTYSGGTVVSGGTLLLNSQTGSATGTSGLVTVSSGGIIGGNGRTSSLISINSGASFRPGGSTGSSTGLLTSTSTGVSALNLNTGSTTLFDINGISRGAAVAGYDGFDTAGRVNFGGDFTINFSLSAPNGTTVYDLFGFASVGAFDFTSVNLTGAYTGAFSLTGTGGTGVWSYTSGTTTFSFAQGSGDLTVTAVPEPSTYVMLIGGLGMMLVIHRSRRRQA